MTQQRAHGFYMQERFDFPDRTPARLFYILATTPRCGSNMLSHALWETGALGAPAEYFNFDTNMPAMIKRLDAYTIAEYAQEVMARRTSPNGVFALKAHFSQLQIMRILGFEKLLGQAKYIRLLRKDRLAQAISFVRAAQTGRYTSFETPEGEPHYDFTGIQSAYNGLGRENASWTRWFREKKIAPLVLVYEEICSDLKRAAARVAEYLGVSLAGARPVSLPPLEKLGDRSSLEWASRFRAEARAKGLQLEPA